jgi:hypothetical protein
MAALIASTTSARDAAPYVDQVTAVLHRSSPAAVVSVLARLTPDALATMLPLCESGSPGIAARVRAAMPTFSAPAPAPAVAPTPSAATPALAPARAPAPAPAPAPSAAAAFTPRPVAAAVAAATPAAAAALHASHPPAAHGAAGTTAAPLAGAGGHSPRTAEPLPLTQANLELIRDALASDERDRVVRALHFFGRTIDLHPVPAAPGGAAVPPPAAVVVVLPATLPHVPLHHATDPLYMATLGAAVQALAAVVARAAGVGPSGGGAATVDLVLLQTALSVVRKLFRNAPAYVVVHSALLVHGLLRAVAHVTKDTLAVMERSVDECVDKLPPPTAVAHLVAIIVEMAAGDGSVDFAAGAAAHQAVTVAALTALARLTPRVAPPVLLAECDKGRLLEAAARHFLSTSTDVRRAVVSLLVALQLRLEAAFLRYVEAYLSVPQQKLLAIYVAKQQEATAGGVGGAGR